MQTDLQVKMANEFVHLIVLSPEASLKLTIKAFIYIISTKMQKTGEGTEATQIWETRKEIDKRGK